MANEQKCIHICYADTLPAKCAAAILLLKAGNGSAFVRFYKLHDDYPGKVACLYDQIWKRLYPRQEQIELTEVVPVHDPALHTIYLIDAGKFLIEEATLQEIGAVIVLDNFADDSVCARAWHISFGHRSIPVAVQLLNRFAIGSQKIDGMTSWLGEVIPFSLGIVPFPSDPNTDEGWEEWEKHFDKLANTHTGKRVKEGQVILAYLAATHADYPGKAE
jgi:hypothetical protein